jgi:uncharacterized membrane protein
MTKNQEEIMTGQPGSEITSDDKLWAALGYIIALLALIALLMEDKKKRPFIKFHAVQSLILWIAISIIFIIGSVVTLGIGSMCLWILYLIVIWPAIDSYGGNYTNLPLITDFIKGQKWA